LEKTWKDEIVNKFLVLCLVESGVRLGDTKLQKFAYLTQFDLTRKGIKALNFDFIKMPYGPFSPGLKDDVESLVNCHAVTQYAHRSTLFGKRILKNFGHLKVDNRSIIESVKDINEKYMALERDELVVLVHEMTNPLRPWLTIDKTPHGTYLLKKMETWNDEFKLSMNDLASLEIYFDPLKYLSLRRSLEEAKTCAAVNIQDVPEFA